MPLSPSGVEALAGPFAAVQSDVLELLASGAALAPVLERLATGVEGILDEGIVSILVVDGRVLRYVATPSLPRAYVASVEGMSITPNLGTCLAAAASRQPVIVEDVTTHPNWAGYAHLATDHGLRACWSTPVLAPSGDVLGTFAVYYRRPMSPPASALGVVAAATALAAIVMRHDLAQRALRVSDERFRQMAETIDDIFWLQDADSRQVLYVSPAFETVVGLPCHVLYENPDAIAARVLPDDRERLMSALANAADRADIEFRIRRPDGGVRWLHGRRLPVFDATGRLTRLVGITHDVTERKQIEHHLLQSQRVETVGTLAAGIAHDLNNVLTPILLAASSLRGDAPAETRESLITAIEDSASRGAALVQQILHFARGADGEAAAISVADVLEDVLRLTRETMGRDVSVCTDVAAGVPAVLCGSTQLHQVVLNLVVNARDAMPEGGRITIAAARAALPPRHGVLPPSRDGYVHLSVRDTGTGIPAELHDRIFDPFYTTKPLGHGSGLGLSIVLAIVGRHHGHVAVESEMGRGTTFHVYLPAAPRDAPTHQAAGAARQKGASAPRARVLVVDDEAAILEVMKVGLGQAGYVIHTAASGSDALELLAAIDGAVDFALLDVMMPGMDGVTLAGIIRERYPRVAIAAATGLPTDQLERRLREAGVCDYLIKPYDAARVSSIIQSRVR